MLVGVMNNTTNTQSAQPAAHTPGPWILQIDENDIFVEVVDSPTEEPFLRPSRLMNSAMPTPALSLKWPTVCGCHRWNQLSKSMVGGVGGVDLFYSSVTPQSVSAPAAAASATTPRPEQQVLEGGSAPQPSDAA